MAPYTPRASNFAVNMVGSLYHIGIGDGTRSYGFVFQNDGQQSQGMWEKSNVADKEKLIQYSSPNLIDRDFAYYPRVTQGDYSGGGLQTVFLDATKFLDSDLEITTPSYLQLRSSWLRKTVTLASPSSINQVVAFNNDLYYTYGETNGKVYQLGILNNAAPTSGSPVAASVVGLFTDGASLFAGTGGNVYATGGNVATWGAITGGVNGTATKWWEVEQGTSGRFIYYESGSGPDNLYKVDLTAVRPVAPANQPQVPTGSVAVHIVDLVAYQGSIALLTTDSTAANGFDVWYHDGTNMTRIIRVEGYRAMGMCNSLGNLYVSAQDQQTGGGPALFQVGSSGFQVVARPAVPNFYDLTTQAAGQPRSVAEYVYWPVRLVNTPLSLVTPGAGYNVPRTLVYNTLTGAISYLPNMDNLDFGAVFQFAPMDQSVQRMVAGLGAGIAFAYQDIGRTVGTLQYQQVTANLATRYQPSGWMVSSKMDFGTPGIPKRFRRIMINHSPLRAGESLTVKAFVDQDPLGFSPSLAPVPATASVTDNFLTSTVTLLPLGQDTVGYSLYYAMQLNAGTSQATTPRVIWSAVEVGGTWVWDFTLDCSNRRRDLKQRLDNQGPNGKDLYFMLRNAYENGVNLTLYLTPTLSYTVNVENLEGKNIAYADHAQQAVKADEEWLVHVVLRQVAA